MAHGGQPVSLVPRRNGRVCVAYGKRAAAVHVAVLRRAVSLGVVGVAIHAIAEETIARAGHNARPGAIARLVVGIGFARKARGDELVGTVERVPARALRAGQ